MFHHSTCPLVVKLTLEFYLNSVRWQSSDQSTSVCILQLKSHCMQAHKISLIKLTKLFREPVLSSAAKHTNTPTHSVCKGQIYFNKTSELQPQFHFDEFPPAGVSQAVGGRAERREREVG